MSKKNWNKPEINTLELDKTLSPVGDKSCMFYNDPEGRKNCPGFVHNNTISLLPDDEAVTFNNCQNSHGNDCTWIHKPVTPLPDHSEGLIPLS